MGWPEKSGVMGWTLGTSERIPLALQPLFMEGQELGGVIVSWNRFPRHSLSWKDKLASGKDSWGCVCRTRPHECLKSPKHYLQGQEDPLYRRRKK